MILQGTTDTGQVIPVQVDSFGRLVAEGLQGVAGPPGPAGPPGAQIAVTVSATVPSGTANEGDLWIQI